MPGSRGRCVARDDGDMTLLVPPMVPTCLPTWALARSIVQDRTSVPRAREGGAVRFLYIDIDTLRADHVGCYGYHRDTTPTLDATAAEGVRFEHCHVSDSPCLPSRSALISGRFGIHNGAVAHGGASADPFADGSRRRFTSRLGATSWAKRMRDAGLETTTISTFAERHSAWHWYAGFSHSHNVGKGGMETAEEVTPVVLDWLARHGRADDWFLHVHLWDPHSPYRTPLSYGEPFAGEPIPGWLTDDVRQDHWNRPGPYSAQDFFGFSRRPPEFFERYPRQPSCADSMDSVRRMFDGYDTGIRYADDHVGRIVNRLAELGVLDDTAIMVSSDHGDTLGELNVYCDHKTGDEFVTRVPMILRWPGVDGGRVDDALHYQIDVAATTLELLGVDVPDNWDGRGFADALREGEVAGRDHLVLSHSVWAVQRSVRLDDYLVMRTYHSGFRDLRPLMAFDLAADPHEQVDIADDRPDVAQSAMAKLEAWQAEMMLGASHASDPLWTTLGEGGPFELHGRLPAYLERLKATGRERWAAELASQYPASTSR